MLPYCKCVTIDDQFPASDWLTSPDPVQPGFSYRNSLSALSSDHFSKFSFNLTISLLSLFLSLLLSLSLRQTELIVIVSFRGAPSASRPFCLNSAPILLPVLIWLPVLLLHKCVCRNGGACLRVLFYLRDKNLSVCLLSVQKAQTKAPLPFLDPDALLFRE